VHQVEGLGRVTCLDLLWTLTSLTVAVATSVTQHRPGEGPVSVCSDVTILTCRDGADWQTSVIRPSHDHTPASVRAKVQGCMD
jgi:hypothetical protein